MSGIIPISHVSPNSRKSVLADSVPTEIASSIDEQPSERSDAEEDKLSFIKNSGEYRLMRAINETFCYNSSRCSTGCLYSMEELIPTSYLLLIDERNNSWFSMQLLAGRQSVQLWYADFSVRFQEALDVEARRRLFMPANCHVFAGAKHQEAGAGAPLHCRRFAYLPSEVLNHPSLMLHHLPISPDQLLLVDHVFQAAAYVTVIVGVANQPHSSNSSLSYSNTNTDLT